MTHAEYKKQLELAEANYNQKAMFLGPGQDDLYFQLQNELKEAIEKARNDYLTSKKD